MTSELVKPGLAKNEDLQRSEVCNVGRWMYERGSIVAAQGNISVRLRNGNILMTPTRVNKGMLDPGEIPLARYATPGTPELTAVLEPFVPHYDALLLANHGAVTCGRDLLKAFFHMETIERTAKITLAAEAARVPVLRPNRKVEKLKTARARNSVSLAPCKGGLPATDDDKESAVYHFTRAHLELNAQIAEVGRNGHGRSQISAGPVLGVELFVQS